MFVARPATIELIAAVVLVSSAGGPDGIEVVAASAVGVAWVAVAGAGIACGGRDGDDGRDPSAHALTGSTRATAPTAAIASGRTRAGRNRLCNPQGVSSRSRNSLAVIPNELTSNTPAKDRGLILDENRSKLRPYGRRR